MTREPLLSSMRPSMKLLSLVVIVIASFLFTFLSSFLLAMLIWGKDVLDNLVLSPSGEAGDSNIVLLKFFQVANQLGIFIIPSVLFALLQGQSVSRYMLMDRTPDRRMWIISAGLIIVILPLINWLMDLNNSIVFPEFLAGLEQWFKGREEEAALLTEAFLNTGTWQGFTMNVFMIGMLAALGEEFIFRGILLRLFHEWSRNVHIAVFISALLFSALHFQFYGIIPRLVLGMVLGYAYVWSGTLWVPIFIHFLNNLMAVTIAYLSNIGFIHTDFESFGSTSNVWLIATSLLVTVGLMLIMRSWRWASEQ